MVTWAAFAGHQYDEERGSPFVPAHQFPPRSGQRSGAHEGQMEPTTPANPFRARCRAEAAPKAVDRGWEIGGFELVEGGGAVYQGLYIKGSVMQFTQRSG